MTPPRTPDRTVQWTPPGWRAPSTRCKTKLLPPAPYESATVTDSGGILLENNQADSPDYGAIYLGPGLQAIANRKNGMDWEWRTFGTGAGFTASELIAGVLDAGAD